MIVVIAHTYRYCVLLIRDCKHRMQIWSMTVQLGTRLDLYVSIAN